MARTHRATSEPRTTSAWRASVAALIAAALPMLPLASFTVDDAWVPVRYARSLAMGAGYRASFGAPVTDGVTPLGFAHLLVPFASVGATQAHVAARVGGTIAWLAAAAMLGACIARLGGSRARYAALALLVTSAPVAGWAVAGLETGLVTAFMAVSISLRERSASRAGAVLSGLASGWRPELLPAVVVLAFAAGPERVDSDRREGLPLARSVRVVLALAPAVIVAALRFAVFGRAAPLSIFAKIPVLSAGLAYAGAAALLAGYVAVFAPRGLLRAEGWTRALAGAALVHVGAMAFAGGDWMPLARLAVPVAPIVVLCAARLLAAPTRPAFLAALPLVAATALQIFGFVRALPAVASIEPDRRALIEEMRPVLQDARNIAAVDVGWLSVAAEHARIVDLAGITDPSIATLPGGHTTKRLPRTFFDDRGVDAIVLLVGKGDETAGRPWNERRFARGTEAWAASIPELSGTFHLAYTSRTRLEYIVVKRTFPPPEPPESDHPPEPGGMW